MITSMTAADLTKWIAYGPIKVNHVYGYNNQTTDLFVQFHESPTLANVSEIPAVKAIWAPAKAAFDWSWPEKLPLKELIIGVSTVEASFTQAAAASALDMTIIAETDFPVGANTSVVGDQSSGVKTLQVWSEATGPKRLLRLDIKVPGAAPYARVYASDAVRIPALNINQPLKLTPSTATTLFFGKGGLSPIVKESDGTIRQGCSVFLLQSAADTAAQIVLTNCNIRAIIDQF